MQNDERDGDAACFRNMQMTMRWLTDKGHVWSGNYEHFVRAAQRGEALAIELLEAATAKAIELTQERDDALKDAELMRARVTDWLCDKHKVAGLEWPDCVWCELEKLRRQDAAHISACTHEDAGGDMDITSGGLCARCGTRVVFDVGGTQ